jgi:flavin-dependent dehydrogenase
MSNRRYDAVVVGGRVAGAATGMLLARAGMDVLVLDRSRYGSDILSTHALMRGGVLQLARWGLLDEVIAAGTPLIPRTVMRYGDTEEVIDIKPRPGYDGLYAPRRMVLDRILADAAARAGADVRFGVDVTELGRSSDGRVNGVRFATQRGAHEAVEAPLVIGADGLRSGVAREVGAKPTTLLRHGTAFLVTWYSGVEAEGYQWLYGHEPDGHGCSAGIIPTNDDQVCIWAGVASTRFASRRPEEHLAAVMAAIAPDWAARMAAGRQHGPVRGFAGSAGFLRRAVGPGWALVGDAGSFKDPITAHGLTDALRDAELLARAVVASDGDPDAATLGEYEQTRDELSLPLIRIADQVATYDWTMAELRELLLAMSAAMRPEVAYLEALGEPMAALAGAAV